MYNVLGTIILRECKKLARDFLEHPLLVHRFNKFQVISVTQSILREYNFSHLKYLD